ncbi:TPA: hypothetical protein IUX83_000807 [Enterococcus faecalis]|nr:hypothetical protein [Enterococcus faecalis]
MEWGLFKIRDLFERSRVEGLPSSNYLEGGIPYVSGTNNNNGIATFIDAEEKFISSKNAISIDPINGKVFYHGYEFVGRGHSGASINLLYNLNLNVFVGLFLIVIIEMNSQKKASYGNLFNGIRLSKQTLLMPITSSGEPYWDYMEQYIINLMKNIEVLELEPIKSSSIDLCKINWEILPISQAFESVKRGKRLTKDSQHPGEIPYVSSTAFNNGVDDYISIPNKEYRSFKNYIGINNSGSVGRAFYHSYTTIVSDHVTALSHKRLNKYNAQFLIPCLEQVFRDNYSFNREISDKRLARQKIMLPVTEKGTPDWEFMEDYIKSISNSNLL